MTSLTKAEKTFLDRMIPYIVAGKTLEEAARAVLEDDERLWLIATAKDDQGQFIREELARRVYAEIRP